MVNHMVIACDSRLIRKNITFATDLNSVASMKTEFEWFIFASKAKARKSIHFQRYHHTCLTFSLSARRDGKFVKSRPPPDATGQAYGTSEALAPANPSRTSLDIVGLASFYKLSVVVCCRVFLSAHDLSFDGFAFGRQIQSIQKQNKFPEISRHSSNLINLSFSSASFFSALRWSILVALESLHPRSPRGLPLDLAGPESKTGTKSYNRI